MSRRLTRRTLLGATAAATSLLALPPSPATALVPGRSFGLALPGVPHDLTELDRVSGLLGRRPDAVTWYAAWAAGGDFPVAAVTRLAATGVVPELTWEPWSPGGGTDQPSYRLSRITAGRHDTYLRRWARQVRSYGGPLVIRLAHEMNGSWYPWCEAVNGNRPGDHAAAWRHVVGVLRAEGATNVRWRWSPNVPYAGSRSMATLYPGDGWVDEVALDGYNWGGVQPGHAWTSYADVFRAGLDELATITARPAYVGETGCPEAGGDKAAWLTDMAATLDADPRVRGVTWFHFLKEADWRVDSSPATLAAFRSAVS